MMQIPVYVKETKAGLGIFSVLAVKKDTVIWKKIAVDTDINKYPQSYLAKYAVYNDGTPYLCTDLANFMNHSCDPNTDGEIAIRDIKQDEELTYDYNDEEDFVCSCGSQNCRKIMVLQ